MTAGLWPIFWLTLFVSGTAVVAAAIVGLPLGVALGRKQGTGREWLWALVYTGMGLPPVIVGLVVYILLSRSGPLGGLGWLYSPIAMIVAQWLLAIPFVIGVTATAIAAIPRELEFQLKTLGADRRQTRWMLLREARPGVFLALATAMGRSLSEVGAVLMVGGNIEGHTRVLTTAIILETSKGHFNAALLLGSVLLSITLALNVVILRWRGGFVA